MRLTSRLYGSVTVLGIRFPLVVALLVGTTLAATVLGAVGVRSGFSWLQQGGMLLADSVWAGQVWRLVTWPFFFIPSHPMDGFFLILGCFALWWLGTELVRTWGPVRFLLTYLGFALATGVVTCLIFLGWRSAGEAAGPWPLIDALIIAWAVLMPHREILMFFMVPMRGRNLVYATIGGTFLYALLFDFGAFVPNFVAEGLMLVYLRDDSLHSLWLRLKLRALQARSRRKPAHLRPVARDDDPGKPPRWLH